MKVNEKAFSSMPIFGSLGWEEELGEESEEYQKAMGQESIRSVWRTLLDISWFYSVLPSGSIASQDKDISQHSLKLSVSKKNNTYTLLYKK